MTVELSLLACAVVFGLVQIVVAAQFSNHQQGYSWAAGPRDDPKPEISGLAGRLDRALRNYVETFPFFAAAVLVAHAVDRHSWMTVLGAHLYFWARLVYLPLYALGIFLVRSLVWNIAFVGIVLILLDLL